MITGQVIDQFSWCVGFFIGEPATGHREAALLDLATAGMESTVSDHGERTLGPAKGQAQ